MKYFVIFTFLFQSLLLNASVAERAKENVSLRDLVISYSYELEAKKLSADEVKLVESLFKAKINAYMEEKGANEFRKELKTFIESFPKNDQTELLIKTVQNQKATKAELQSTLIELNKLDQVVAGDSANWSFGFLADPVMALIAVGVVALVTYLIADAIIDDEKEYGDDNGNTGSVDGTNRIVLSFYGSDSVYVYGPSDEEDTFWDPCDEVNTWRLRDNAEYEALSRCLNDYRVVERGLQAACRSNLTSSVSSSFDTSCDADARTSVSYTVTNESN